MKMKASFKHLITIVILFIYPFKILALAAVHSIKQSVKQSEVSAISNVNSSYLVPKLEFEYLSFLSTNKASFDSEQYASQLTSTGLSLKLVESSAQVNIKWFYVAQEQANYFDVSELSRTTNVGESKITIGRHLHNWSYADSFWQQGRWQPRFLWDYYSAHEQGLVGVFIETNFTPKDHLTFFSGLHAPDIGAKYYEEDGRVISKNPWFHSPPERVLLWDQKTPVYSKVEEPRIIDVALRPSLAIQYGHDWSSVSQLRAAYAYKPINQTILAFEHHVVLPEELSDTQRVVVTVQPDYYYAHLATLENSWAKSQWRVTPSVTYESPILKQKPNEWISQMIGPTTSLSLMVERQFGAPRARIGRAYAGVLRLIGGREPDSGEKAAAQTFFQYREIYFMAYRAGVEGRLARIARKNINAKSEVTFDSAQKGGTVINELSAQISPSLDLSLKVNFIGLISSDNKGYEAGFYNINRVNDLVSVGLNYVF